MIFTSLCTPLLLEVVVAVIDCVQLLLDTEKGANS
jgi:hypothetical protein